SNMRVSHLRALSVLLLFRLQGTKHVHLLTLSIRHVLCRRQFCAICSLKTHQKTINVIHDLVVFPLEKPLHKKKLLYILRKEVIQPHLPIRLPCYDFTPIIGPTFGGWLLKGYLTDFGCYRLSWCDGRCVQGPGTYSPRHSDPRLLAIPASCRRVAAYNPN